MTPAAFITTPTKKGGVYMARSEQIDILLYKAQQDEKVVRCLMDDSEISDEVIGFHVQQAIEKLLKALLVHLNIDFPKTHVLELLVELLEANGVRMPEEMADIGSLTSFAVAFRYDDLPFENSFDRAEGLRSVVLVREWVTNSLTQL
jgi:HEPN domain-containing protein